MPRKKEVVQDETISIALALKELCEAKGLSQDVVISAMEEAMKKAYFKAYNIPKEYFDMPLEVKVDLDAGKIEMYYVKKVVAEIEDDVFETDPEELLEETGEHYNVGDEYREEIDINKFKRAAAMQAKNVFKQKLREAEKQVVVEQYSDKVGDIITGVVDVVEEKHAIVKIGHTSAFLPRASMLPNEDLKSGNSITVYVEEVVKNATGTPIIVSRVNPRLVTRLMEKDISEIYDGTVEIKNISRQPGVRSKVAVYSKDPNIDPSGACIGQRGSRIARVLSQLNGEKIDVVNYSDNPLLYVADALKPAIVTGMMYVDEENKSCRAIVSSDQYSLAIGKEAQNVNLAVRLTGWKIDIKSVEDAEAEGYEYENVEDLKVIAAAKRQRGIPTTPVKPVRTFTPVEPTFEEVDEEEEALTSALNAKVETPVTPAKEEQVVEKEIVKPTKKSSNPNAFSELEAALSNNTPAAETPTPKKKWTKKEDKEEKEEKKEKPTTPSNVLPIYTEEELRAMEEEEEEDIEEYDEEFINDEYDDYYDN